LASSDNVVHLNISAMAKGLYLISLSSGTSVSVLKFVKE
jgi:hypothetical protein